MTRNLTKYPSHYTGCTHCGAEPGRHCNDLRRLNAADPVREHMKYPHASRMKAKTSQVPKRSLRP